MKSIIAAFAVLTVACASAAPSYRAELTVSKYAGSASLADFPVLVRISPQTISGFDYGQCAEGGADLSFIDESESPLDFEIDTWNPALR